MRGIWGNARTVAGDPVVARILAGFSGFVVAEYAVWIGVLVVAFHHGGATASGLIVVAMVVPGTALTPVISALADRRSPTALLAVSYLAQAVSLAAMAAVLWSGASVWPLYALAVVQTTALNLTRPALFALLPSVTRDARQLTAAAALAGWIENGGVGVGALVTSSFLDVHQIGGLFALLAGLLAAAFALSVPVRVRGIGAADTSDDDAGGGTALLDGLRVSVRQRRPRLVVSLLTAQYLVVGAVDVLLVVIALHVLDRGDGWVGYLNTAYGVGGIVASGLTAPLLARRTGPLIAGCCAIVGLGLALTAFTRSAGLVLVLLALVGAGRAVLYVAATTMLQRSVPAETIGRVFGLAEGLSNVGLAVGSGVIPVLVALGGARLALLSFGALLPAVAAAGAATLRRLDSGRDSMATEMALLRSLPHFAGLPAHTLETLALNLERLEAAPGETIIRQGDTGDRFYAIADGEVDVTVDGEFRRRLRRGDGVGEIALLRRVSRTATARAVGPATLYALDAEPFLAAVSGHAPTRRRVDGVIHRFEDPVTGAEPVDGAKPATLEP